MRRRLSVLHREIVPRHLAQATLERPHNSSPEPRELDVHVPERLVPTRHQAEITGELELRGDDKKPGMDKNLTVVLAAVDQALHLHLGVAAVGVADRPDHHQLGVAVGGQHPLSDVRDVVHPLLLHPPAQEDEQSRVGVFVEVVLALDVLLGLALGFFVAGIIELGKIGSLTFRHTILDAADLWQAPEHAVRLLGLLSVVPRHSTDPVALLACFRILDDGLQHVEMAIPKGHCR
mmetsp:Transcript_45303/g.96762  ORF Transcript_45303/g.96762 Transcript_45303/m.96762 type:complete len:234 (-) Transcript_45303:23-724(-)